MERKHLEKDFIEKIKDSQGIIHKVCRIYCENEEHRKDLFQEIMIQLWKSFPSFRGDSKFSSWMYRVALNVAIQDLRKVKKRKLLIFESNEFLERADNTYSEFEDEQFRKLYRAISHLNKVNKAIVFLYLEGKSTKEIGNIVGITPNYVRVKMNRIRKKLSDKIKNV